MRDYKKVCRCRDCGKIYDKGIPYICSKCGAEIGRPTPTILQMMGSSIRKSILACVGRGSTPQERVRAKVQATGNKWAVENFNATHN